MEERKREYDRDGPIDGSDILPDALYRNTFAKHLAEIIHIKPTDECFTASLEGPWGYGKSSVIEMVKRHLKEAEDPPIVITFNPWLISDEESLIQKFIIQFASQLQIPDRPKENLKAAKELLAYSKLFDVVKLIPGAEPWATTFQTVFKRFGGAAEKIGKLKELDLEGRKDQVKKAVESLNKSIVVIIDDIDRLTPDEAFKIIKISKAIADFKGTSFLLAFDHDYLADSLKGLDIKNAHQYVEKVVQLRIPLPLIAMEGINELSNKLLANLSDKDLTGSFEDDSDRFGYIYNSHAKFIIKSPRHLKRIFNHLRFVLTQTEGEVCFTDLYALSVLAIRAPHVYEDIKNDPGRYMGQDFERDFYSERKKESPEEIKTAIEKLLEDYNDFEKTHIYGLVEELFPNISEKKYSVYSHDFDKAGRVAGRERLYVALHYQVPKSFISENEFSKFIDGEVDRARLLKGVIENRQSDRLFDLMTNRKNKVAVNGRGVLLAIYDGFLWSDQVVEEETIGLGFGTGTFLKIGWVTRDIIDHVENRGDLIFEILREPKYLPISREIIRRAIVQYSKEEDNQERRQRGEPWLNEEELEKAKALWIETAMNDLKSGRLLDSPFASYTYFLARSEFPDKVQELFEKWLEEPDGLKKIALLIGRSGSDSTKGPYSEIKLDDLGKLLDLQKLQGLVQTELDDPADLSPYSRAVYSSITTGDKYYLADASKGEKF